MRRLVHLLLVVSVIVTVRACGGLSVAGDRMTANTRWIAEKTGITALRDKWREDVVPRITGARRNAWQRVEQATSTALERLAAGTSSVGKQIDSGAAAAAATIKETAVGTPAQSDDAGSPKPPAGGGGNAPPSGSGAP